MQFRRKPTVVEAVKWVGYFDIMPATAPTSGSVMLRLGLGLLREEQNPQWLEQAIQQKIVEMDLLKHPYGGKGAYEVRIHLRFGSGKVYEVEAGDWLVKDGQTIYAVKPEIFKATYETYEESLDSAPAAEEAEPDLYFSLREEDGYECVRSATMSLAAARERAQSDVEIEGCATAVVCREVTIYRRRYVSEEVAPKAIRRGQKAGEQKG